jgi:hypothetical protein
MAMGKFIDGIPYGLLIPAALFLGLAPFYPLPHAVEKLVLLAKGALNRPVDIFDLCFHLAPLALLLVKIVRGLSGTGRR